MGRVPRAPNQMALVTRNGADSTPCNNAGGILLGAPRKAAFRIRSSMLALGVILCATMTICMPASAAAAVTQQSTIVYGFPEFPPLSFTNTRGEPDGYLVHLTNAMFARLDIRSRGAIYPARRLFDNLANGSIDFSMVVHNPQLDNCCLFSKQAAVRDDLRVYHRDGMRPVNGKADLAGKRIITIQGFSYAGLINFIKDEKNRIVNEVAPTHEAAFNMLDAGRADYVLDYAGPASVGLAAHPMHGLRYEVIDHLDVYLVLSKSYPDAARLLPRLTSLVKAMQNEPAFRVPDNS